MVEAGTTFFGSEMVNDLDKLEVQGRPIIASRNDSCPDNARDTNIY